jgi:type II secretory pathway component PulF
MPAFPWRQNKDIPVRRFRWLSNLSVAGLSSANVFLMLFIVPKFQGIYADALPGKPLPAATEFIISGHTLIAAANFLILIVCLALMARKWRYAALLTDLSSVANFLQVAVTVIALFMPMVGITTGMADRSL